MSHKNIMRTVALACGVALLFAGAALAAGPAATAQVGATQIDWTAAGSFGLKLTVSGPQGFHMEKTFDAGQAASFSLFDGEGQLLPAGSYTYELRAIPQLDKTAREALAAARRDGASVASLRKAGILPARIEPLTGAFVVRDGAIVSGGAKEPGAGQNTSANGIATKDQVIADDLIVDGSACIGMDCSNGENFGFDTLRLKENNLRIKFDDTSNSGSFPSNDWQLTANGSNNGDASYFAIDDITGGKTPFKVQAGAPNNALLVENGGFIGFGTSNPAVNLHVVDGNTPTLRLDQDGSDGFTAQTWDVAGNEANFFVRDVTNGSKLSFRIQPGAPESSIYVKSDGDVGLGTSGPSAKLDVRGDGIFQGSDGTTAVTIQETSSSAADRNLLTLENNGPPTIFFRNNNASANTTWTYTVNNSGVFQINASGSGAPTELLLSAGGDMTIGGMLTEGSSRDIKTGFEALDPQQVLDRVSALPVTSWSYTADETGTRHIGPMAEDFYAAFNVGVDDKHISPSDKAGVALLAIQGLNKALQAKEAEIAQVKKETTELLGQKDQQIEELNARLDALEKLVEQR